MIHVDLKNHGFQPDEIMVDHYILGGYSKIKGAVIMPEGHGWGKYSPLPESQNKNGLETMNCTNYGMLNCIESLARFHGYDLPTNFSERYTGVLTGTTESGNSPHKVAEIIRTKAGLIPEEMLPFNEEINSWDEYYSPNPMTKQYKKVGRDFLDKWRIGHDWVFTSGGKGKQEDLKHALSLGAVAVSVLAWKNDGDLFVKNDGEQDNHWVQLLDYMNGEYWIIRDQYEPFEKKLAWNYDFGMAKVYYLTPNMAQKKSGWQRIAELLNYWLHVIFS